MWICGPRGARLMAVHLMAVRLMAAPRRRGIPVRSRMRAGRRSRCSMGGSPESPRRRAAAVGCVW